MRNQDFVRIPELNQSLRGRAGGARGTRSLRKQRWVPVLELLERIELLSGISVHNFLGSITPISSPFGGPASGLGFTPSVLLGIYGINKIQYTNAAGSKIQGNGSGETIAIVDGFSDPNITSELQTFDTAFSLSAPPSLSIMNQTGGTSLPSAGTADDLIEIALDVEWAHAAAPGANIVLLEANTLNNSDLLTAVDTARNLPGVVSISMSWGGPEYSTETADDAHFTTPSGHIGVSFFASSGDDGGVNGPSWPAVSPGVVAVGGTTLTLQTNGNYLETGWSGSGGGISAFENQPAYQNGVVTQSTTHRTSPDVAYDANPSTGVDVYSNADGWIEVGGTSASSPQWAGLMAIIDQGRAIAGLGSLDGPTQTLPALYSLPADFNQITSGSNSHFSAGPGYNLVTGMGSPTAVQLAIDLTTNGGSSNTITNPTGGNLTAVAGTALTGIVGSFSDSNPNAKAGSFKATINWGNGDTSAGTVTLGSGGVFQVTGTDTYHQYGSYTISLTITSTTEGNGKINGLTTVLDAPITASGIQANLTQGSNFISVIGSFQDGNPFATLGQFVATIDWGDGTTSTGTVATDPNGGFDIIGSHDYSTLGGFVAKISISSAGGSQASANSNFNVAPPSGSAPVTGTSGPGTTIVLFPPNSSPIAPVVSSTPAPAVTPAPAAAPGSTLVGFGSNHQGHRSKIVHKSGGSHLKHPTGNHLITKPLHKPAIAIDRHRKA